jgi:hypothetical protein
MTLTDTIHRCPLCQGSVRRDDAQAVCCVCLARHHIDCWDDGARCGRCGGQEGFGARPRRSWRRLRVALVVVSVAALGLSLAAGIVRLLRPPARGSVAAPVTPGE